MSSFVRLLDSTARCLGRYEHSVAERTVLAAVSGGLDSTVLLLALVRLRDEERLPGPLHVCHVDHGVHAGSREAAQRVVDLCDRLDVPVTVRRLVQDRARPGEQALRDARYEALAEVAAATNAGLLVTAHHADDNLETVLFRMLRGTGPRGLAGIPEARWAGRGNHRLLLVRPFLRTRRSTLEHILHELGETEVAIDPTNLDLGYARNRLRHETIPALRTHLGVGLDVALMTVSSTARAATDILEAQGRRILAQRARNRTAWRLELDLRAMDEDSRPFVTEALRQAHLTLHPRGEAPLRDWLDRSTALLVMAVGKRVSGRGGLLLERTREGVLLVDPARAGNPPNTEGGGQLFSIDTGRHRFGATEWSLAAYEHPLPPLAPSPAAAGRFRALLDPRRAPGPWRLRTRRAGDVFQPLGGEHDQDLRRFLQSRHLPRFDRDRLPLLVDANDQILWIPGIEISERVRLLLNTRRCIEVVATCG
ncbi:MAG: tRNA lysidine(34) synthetase TilS [Planctomycetes bacterium]|nr:tRNA lysidine(34) synthetase TilS [Planctomycetota bacterium]